MPATSSAPASKTTTQAEQDHAHKLIKAAVADGNGAAALLNVPPVAFKATLDPRFSPTAPETLYEPSVELTAIVNPLFDAIMLALGFERSTERSYRIGISKKTRPEVLYGLLEAIPPRALIAAEPRLEKGHREGMASAQNSGLAYEVMNIVRQTALEASVTQQDVTRRINNGVGTLRPAFTLCDEVGGVYLSTQGTQLYVRVITAGPHQAPNGRKSQFRLWPGCPNLARLKTKSELDAPRVSPPEALAALKALRLERFPIFIGKGIAEVKGKLDGKVLALREPGSPGLARLLIEPDQLASMPEAVRDQAVPMAGPAHEADCAYSLYAASAAAVDKLTKKIGAKNVIADPRIADVVAMAAAKPNGKRDPLRPYQDEAVAVHMATRFGYVNACATGTGKTVMALTAMRERALALGSGYRGLVVCPAAVRSQWKSETHRFFPEATVHAFQGKELEAGLAFALADAGENPCLIVTSFDTMRDYIALLDQVSWADLICDEAAILANNSSNRSQALWRLRQSAEVAVAMSGTPITRSLDDLGRLLAWARNDAQAFNGARLSVRFDMEDADDVESFVEAIGPVLYRRDKSVIADQLPKVEHRDRPARSRACRVATRRGRS